MGGRLARILATFFFICGPLSLASTARAQQPSAQSPQWIADWGERRCALMRSVPGDPPLTFSLRIIPGNPFPELLLVNPAWRQDPFPGTMPVRLVLLPGGEQVVGQGSVSHLEETGPRVLEVNEIPADFSDKLSAASAISIRIGRRELARVPTPQAAAAVHALRECNDALLRAWGVDPAAIAALRNCPRPTMTGRWFSSEDYPRTALRSATSGLVTFRYSVAADGRVTDCAIVASSGNSDLDATTCRLFRRRATFLPAIGRDGQPTAATMVMSVTWIVPRSNP